MATITIPDDTYAALSRRAAAVGVSPGEYIALTLNGEGQPPPPPTLNPDTETRREAFEEMTALVQSLAHLFPPDHETDVSRESVCELGATTKPAAEATPQVLEGEAWRKAFEEFNRMIRATAGEYPPGFELDVSREAMYEERERAQA